MSVAGSTPGATPEQMAAWHARLAVNKEGVLYEDSFTQIGLKTDYQGTQGKLNLFVGNKKQEAITDLKLSVAFTDEVSGMCGNPGTVIEPRQQMQISVSVECRGPFCGSLPLEMHFAVGFEQRRLQLRLPVVVAKFFKPLPLDDAAFSAKWEGCAHQGSGAPIQVQSNDKWCNEQTLRALMLNGVHMGVVEGRGSGALAAAASLAGIGGEEVLVELVLENRATKVFALAVRSDNALLRESVEDLLKVILQSTRK